MNPYIVTTYRTEHEVYAGTITGLLVKPGNDANMQVNETFSLFRRNDSESALRFPGSFIQERTWRHKSDWTPRTWIIAWVIACYSSFAEQLECLERDRPAYACNEYTASACNFVQKQDYNRSDMQLAHRSYSACNRLNWIILHSKQLRFSTTFSTDMVYLGTYAYRGTSTWHPGQLIELHAAVYWSILGDYIKKVNLHCTSLHFDKVCRILLRPWDPGVHEIRPLIEMTKQCLQCLSLSVDWRRPYDRAIAWGQAMFLGGSSVTPLCCRYVGPGPPGLWATGRNGLESTKESRTAAVKASNRTEEKEQNQLSSLSLSLC